MALPPSKVGHGQSCQPQAKSPVQATWTAPTAGAATQWEVRLFTGAAASTLSGTSLPVVYAPDGPVSAVATSVGASAYVAGKFATAVVAGDWVGLFAQSATKTTQAAALWFLNLPAGQTSGSFLTATATNAPAFRTPASGTAGPWEWRYVRGASTLVARSRPMIFVPNVVCRANNAPRSTIEHVIIVSTENHSFDTFYGAYCTASGPQTCTVGRGCCEAAPAASGPYLTLTDAQNIAYDPCHSEACETSEMNGGLMNRFRTGGTGSSASNFAVAAYTGTSNDALATYFSWAANGAIGDRFFQSASGASSCNDIYLAYARFLFSDNAYVPASPSGVGNTCSSSKKNFDIVTVGDLLEFCGVSWGVFIEGYAAAAASPSTSQCWPYSYDASDVGQSYAGSVQDKPSVYADSDALLARIAQGTLPAVSYVRSLGIHSEHPGQDLTSSQRYIKQFVDAVQASAAYSRNTVVLIFPDESGGYFDHVSPPPSSTVDGKLYGPRLPFTAVGYQVNQNWVSHAQMEPASTIAFVEWNWLANGVGQLGARDAVVNNIGSVLNATRTGVAVPG